MADLSITAANVVSGSGATITKGVAGTSITAGQALQVNGSGNLVLAKADTLADATCVGIALNNAASGQPVLYQSAGNINIGATLSVGTLYVVSGATAGNIAPISDMSTGNYETVLGYASTTSNLVMSIIQTSVAHA